MLLLLLLLLKPNTRVGDEPIVNEMRYFGGEPWPKLRKMISDVRLRFDKVADTQGNGMSNPKVWDISSPKGFEVNRQADLPSTKGMPLNGGILTDRYIFTVFPSSSGISISGAVAGYVAGISN